MAGGGLREGKPCCLEFPDLLQSLCLWAARGRMLFGFRASSGVSMCNPLRFNGDDPFPRCIFIDLGRSQRQGKNNDLNETEGSAVLTVEGRSPRALAQDACPRTGREDQGLVFLQRAFCGRAGSGGRLQDGAEEGGAVGRGGGGGQAPWPGPVTALTPGTSPRCRRDGYCCWSRCHSSGGWSSWLPPAASSACSSEKGREHEWLSGQSTAHPPIRSGLLQAHACSSRLTWGLQPTLAWSQASRVQIPAAPLTSCVTMDKYLNLFVSRSLYWSNVSHNHTCPITLWCGLS